MVLTSAFVLAPGISAQVSGTDVIASVISESDFQIALDDLRNSVKDFRDTKDEELKAESNVEKAKTPAAKETMSTRLADVRSKIESKRKDVLLVVIDIEIKHLNMLGNRVQKMPNITEPLKLQLAAEINDSVQKLNDEKSEVEAASGAEITKSLAKDVRDVFKTHRLVIHKIVDAIHISNANDIIAKAEGEAKALRTKMQSMKTRGIYTTEMDIELGVSEHNINNSKTKIADGDLKGTIAEIKSAYQGFYDITQKIGGLR